MKSKIDSEGRTVYRISRDDLLAGVYQLLREQGIRPGNKEVFAWRLRVIVNENDLPIDPHDIYLLCTYQKPPERAVMQLHARNEHAMEPAALDDPAAIKQALEQVVNASMALIFASSESAQVEATAAYGKAIGNAQRFLDETTTFVPDPGDKSPEEP